MSDGAFIADLGHFFVKSGLSGVKVAGRGARARGKQSQQPSITTSRNNGFLQLLQEAKEEPQHEATHDTTSATFNPTSCSSAQLVIHSDRLTSFMRQFLRGENTSTTLEECKPMTATVAESSLILLHSMDLKGREREKLIHHCFEEFQCKRLYLGISPVCSLYATGNTSGTVVSIGHAATHTVPIVDGQIVRPLSTRSALVSGLGQSLYLKQRLHQECGVPWEALGEDALHATKKQKLSFSSHHASQKDIAPQKHVFVLPDGHLMDISVPETIFESTSNILFQPKALNSSCDLSPCFELGISQMLQTTLRNCALTVPDARKVWMVCGGPAAIPGLVGHLSDQLHRHFHTDPLLQVAVKQVEATDPITCAWEGAFLLSQIASFQSMLVSKADYEEKGPWLVEQGFHNDYALPF